MGIGYTPYSLNVQCSDDCDSDFHILIENDYENHAFAWGAAVGSHKHAIQYIRPVVEEYLQDIDNESTFFLQPSDLHSVGGMVRKIQAEIDEFKKANEEDSMETRTCTLPHDEFGPIEFQVPAEVTVQQCPWHNADGSFDREAYLETLPREITD